MKDKKNIPVHHLNHRADFGLEMGHTSFDGAREELEGLTVHRDDCYSFLLVETGEGSMDVDFVHINLPVYHIYYLVPGQIHHNIKTYHSDTWYISVNALLVPKNYREVFENNLLQQKPHLLSTAKFKQFQDLINVLNDQCNVDRGSGFYKPVIYSLLESLLGLYARIYERMDTRGKKTSRLFQISLQFKNLVVENVRQNKRPSFYAGKLNISESYLNEAVKKITGFTATYWLMNEVMLEAKRLLIYGQLNVKEIAYTLGYEDHTYFSKLFKKQSKVTPTAFRDSYLK